MIRMDHVMVRTLDLQKSIAFYTEVFGMELESFDPHPENNYDLAFMKDIESGMKIELTYNYETESYGHGDAFGHISFYTDDAEKLLHQASVDFGCTTRSRIHESSHDKKYIIGVVESLEGIEIAVVQKL